MITILYTRQDSIYKQLECDTYDINRDARKWPGGTAIIAHPPCRAWGQLKHFAKPRHDEPALAIHAIIMIRLYNGILEHPSNSTLWQHMNLPQPGQKPDQYGGWTLNIDQKWFGHRAIKRTNLYIVGCTPKQIPPYPIKLHRHQITVEDMAKNEREKTPPELAKWLIKLATICNNKLLIGTHTADM